ncbi:hypothetical protein ABVD55_004644 [Vibrio harveyi]
MFEEIVNVLKPYFSVDLATYVSTGIALIELLIKLIVLVGASAFVKNFIFGSNCKHLEVKMRPGIGINVDGKLLSSVDFDLKNSGASNIYISRAYFCDKKICFGFIPRKSALSVYQYADRLRYKKNCCELKFLDGALEYLTDTETVIRPGSKFRVQTSLPLESSVDDSLCAAKESGVLYLEYSMKGQQGLHKVKL